MHLRVRLLGHDVACRVTAPVPGGPDVVLVHGIGVSGRYFAPLVDALTGAARAVVPDLVGFGGSPRAGAPLGIAEHAAVVGALADRLGLERPVVVGHSMGAQVATELAVTAPGAVAGVVLLGPVADPRARSAAAQGRRLLRDVRHEPPRWVGAQVREYLRCGPRWYLATVPHMLGYPTAERLAEVRVPVLLVRGEHDPVAPAAYLDDLAAAAPTARRVVVPRGGHLVQVAAPGLLTDAVLGLAAGCAA